MVGASCVFGRGAEGVACAGDTVATGAAAPEAVPSGTEGGTKVSGPAQCET